ncbi:MAG: hypothetical protein M1837_003301 [Sclerophora amabilis]|nr:MAG: hypothetical protein M1837_003301 [Sclerophora amabilis]
MLTPSPTSPRILLKNGTLLLPKTSTPNNTHPPSPVPSHPTATHTTIQPVRADLLISPPRILKIAPHIDANDPVTADAEPGAAAMRVIDCTGKLISPGFVDTHHHLWQTQLKGRHADEGLLDYFYSGNFQSSQYTPRDIFWGQLGGCLEAIDAGTTTVVDHAHLNYSTKHSSNALSATISSGIRSFFCYCPTLRNETWTPEFKVNMDLMPEWAMGQLEEWARQQPFGEGRVRLGFAFDAFFLPKEVVQGVFEKVRSWGIKLITTHYVRNAIQSADERAVLMDSWGLLKNDILFSHSGQATSEDARLMKAAGAYTSATPDTELQMAIGQCVCFRPDMQEISSLGIDCHSNNSADILTQMRLALQNGRALRNQRFIDAGKVPTHISPTVEEAFNLGTIQGARAVHMEDEIGSLAEGKLADIVIFDMTTPGMVCAAEHDPVAAIVQHASVRDIDTVIVNGEIRKEAGKLLPVEVDQDAAETEVASVGWKDVAHELLASRATLQEKIEKLDFDVARKGVMKAFYIDEDVIVEDI